MSEQGKDQAAARPMNNQVKAQRPAGKAVSDPREVATLVMARMNVVNSKKDELTIAIKGLSDITQQLAMTYAEQLRSIEGLSSRLKALEAAARTGTGAGTNGAAPTAAEQN